MECPDCKHRLHSLENHICSEEESSAFTERAEFLQYMLLIEDVVHDAADRFTAEHAGEDPMPVFVGLNTREIHEGLGDDEIRREWTLDALALLKSVEHVHVISADRWRPIPEGPRMKRPVIVAANAGTQVVAADIPTEGDEVKVATKRSRKTLASGRNFSREEISALVRKTQRTYQKQYRSSAPTVRSSAHY